MRGMPALDDRVSEDRYGCFTVLFSNVEGYDLDEITETFSEFGEVLGVRRAGDDWGIHFVTFGSYDDAKNAVDGLEDHPDIHLKVHHKNKPQYNRRRNFDGYEDNNRRYDAPRRWYATNDAGYNDSNGYVRREREFVNDWADDRLMMMGATTEDESGETSEHAENEMSWCELQLQRYLEAITNNDTRVEQKAPASIESVVVANTTEIEEPVTEEIKAEDVESISSSEEESIPETVIEMASEIIVGNVDTRIDEAFLLHLFATYEPIAVSQLVPVTSNAEVRYCSVYFKGDEVAKRVERMCDMLCVAGRQIIVQRPSRLIATYLTQI